MIGIIFEYEQKKKYLKVEETTKMRNIVKYYVSKSEPKLDLSKIYFLFNGTGILFKDIGNKTISEMMSSTNKEEKLLSIVVEDYSLSRMSSLDKSIIKDDEKDNDDIEGDYFGIIDMDEIIEKDYNGECINIKLKEPLNGHTGRKKEIFLNPIKKLYFQNFILLSIQFTFILILTIIGFITKLNQMLLDANVSLVVKIIPVIAFIFLTILIFLAFFFEYKKYKIIIIFHIFYGFYIIYYGLLLLGLINLKYIIISLSLILIEIFSILINLFMNKFDYKYIVLSSSILSLIGLIFFSTFWIKSLYPIIYISIFWLLSNGYYILIIFIVNKICESDEFLFSSLIFNYSIFLGLGYIIIKVIKYIYNYLKEKIRDNNCDDDKKKFYKFNFIILISQYSFILLLTIIGFITKFNKILLNANASLEVKIIPIIAFILLYAIIYMFFYEDIKDNKFFIILHVLYVFFIIHYSLLLSGLLESKYIVISLSLILIEIFSLLINIIFKRIEIIHIILSSLILSLIGLIFFSAFWIQSLYPIIYISIFWLLSNGYYLLIIFITNKICGTKAFLFSSLIFNYSIFLGLGYIIIKVIKPIYNYLKEKIRDNTCDDDKKKFYKFNFIILISQYSFILLLTIIGFITKFNKILINANAPLEVKIVPIIAFILLCTIIYMLFYEDINDNKFLIIFHVLYTFIIIYISLLLSGLIDSKYIIISLSLILIEIFSLLINIIFKRIEIKHIVLSSSILSLIGLIFFSTFWIKSLYPIIYISIFWLLSNGYYILIIFIVNKICESDEFLFSSLFFNYSIFLGLGIFSERLCDEEKFQLKIFGILIIQYIIIITVVWVGFSLKLNYDIKYDITTRGWSCSISTIINFIICLKIIVNKFHEAYNFDDSYIRPSIIFLILYIPIMIIYFFTFSAIIKEKYILSFMFIIFFELLFIILGIFFFKTSHPFFIFLFMILSNSATITPFILCWLHDGTTEILIITAIVDIYIMILTCISRNYDYNNYFICAVGFDFVLFGIVFAIALAILGLIIYLIFLACQAFCNK